MGDLYVSWTDYNRTIERLAANVHRSGWTFNQIVCIARGGLRVGDALSRIFDAPLAIISTASYVGGADNVRGEIVVAKHMTMTTDSIGDAVLLVDDLVDSGATLEVVKKHVASIHPHIRDIRTAVLWYKGCSQVKPDYYVDFLPENPWIHQPFEPYEQMKPADLAARMK
ncbi:MAG: phosphoribosyltransferase [Betaproteobacteria bacterium]|nr:phosphoribosyltransferase [Betaproteobacteria bacterium]